MATSRDEPTPPVAGMAPTGIDAQALRDEVGQIVLVLQGGGALGSYQAGVYEALHTAGIEPDWIIGTSIGAINGGLIAANTPGRRLPALHAFWQQLAQAPPPGLTDAAFGPAAQAIAYWSAVTGGIRTFFEPNYTAFFAPQATLGPDAAAFYSTEPLAGTLATLAPGLPLGPGASPRLTVGAARVRSSEMRYFDSRIESLAAPHIMASGALPPAFPGVRVGDDLYWDGGIMSNTPIEVVFDENPRRNALIIAVQLWSPDGDEPDTIADVLHRQKEIQYASRLAEHAERQKLTHRLRHIIKELAVHIPDEVRRNDAVAEMIAWGCLTRMHVVRLLAPRLQHETQAKDLDFTRTGIETRWRAGVVDMRRALAAAPWRRPVDPLEGLILHDAPFGAHDSH